MTAFDASTPFILIARIKVKPGKVQEYLELATKTDAAVEASEPGMLHHTFDQDPENPLCFTWSEVYKNDDAFLAHLANPSVGDKCKAAMEATGLPVKIFESKCGYSRV